MADQRVFGDDAIIYGSLREAQAIVDKYPVKCTVRVHYDPDNPGTAVLEPGRIGQVLNALVPGVVCLGLGSYVAWSVIALLMVQQ